GHRGGQPAALVRRDRDHQPLRARLGLPAAPGPPGRPAPGAQPPPLRRVERPARALHRRPLAVRRRPPPCGGDPVTDPGPPDAEPATYVLAHVREGLAADGRVTE